MSVYRPTDVSLSVIGVPIQGVMDSTWIEIDFQEDQMMLYKGAQGFGTFVVNANRSGLLKFTTSQKSPSNALLSAIALAGTVGPFQMKDSSDEVKTVAAGAQCAIKKHAPIKRGKEIQGYEWEVLIDELVMTAGGDA